MISVCMASYNGAKYIREQVMSILPQLGKDDEIIISDDGSTDGTLETIQSFNDKRIKVLHHAKIEYRHTYLINFRKVADNFENALSHAKGDIIFLSDQDDIWKEDKVAKMIKALENYDIVECNCGTIDENDNLLAEKFRSKRPFSNSILGNLISMPFLGCCMAFHSKVLNWSLPFPNELIAHDFWIGFWGNQLGNMGYIDEPLHLYRQHTNNVSPGSKKSNNKLMLKLIYRTELLCQIINRLYNIVT